MQFNGLIKDIPTLALRGKVAFPGVSIHLDIGRNPSIEAVKMAMKKDQKIFLIAQRDYRIEEPQVEDFYETGVVACVKDVVTKPGEKIIKAYIEGLCRGKIASVNSESPCFVCDVETIAEKEDIDADENQIKALLKSLEYQYKEYIELSTYDISQKSTVKEFLSESISSVADVITNDLIIDYEKKQTVLDILDPLERIIKLCAILKVENDLFMAQREIEARVEMAMEKNQRDYYYREQVRELLKKLGDDDDIHGESLRYKDRINALDCPEQVRAKLLSECAKLSKMQNGSIDASVIRSYLDTALSMPFGVYTEDNFDLERAAKILDDDHYGLEKIKERFIEMLAVRSMTDNKKGSIICLVGPPGVGKTSIVRSVAKAMNRKYVRLSLGGVSDEAEIRGHRKTYVGAMPGRMVNAIIQAKSFNPIILLDEIDKLGKNFRGDPASAMLEVLDPEQNFSFRDNYMELPIDLSSVLFITTANDPSMIPKPLYDRMEIIELTSYSPEEKFMIAKNHLVKKQLLLHGLNGNKVRFEDNAIRFLIEAYTRESGVRRLEQLIGAIARKSAVKLKSNEIRRVMIGNETVKAFLGPEKYLSDKIEKSDLVGVVNGLAWTSVGGEILQVECITMDGDGKLDLTGSLGDVMKESAKAAYSYIRSVADKYNIDKELFTNKNIHLHVPQGAVPKDGPSAGVTIATALLSALSGMKVKHDVAMTGEITLTGRVLRIGGLKEKAMAAYKSGVRKVLIPKDNLGDLWEIDQIVKDNITFIGVSSVDEVFEQSFDCFGCETDVKIDLENSIKEA